jgi:hypothetical protein
MTEPAPEKRTSSFALVVLCLALVGAASVLYYHQGLLIPRALEVQAARKLDGGYSFGNDFYLVWLTSRECLRQHCDLYSQETTRKIQTGLYGRPLDPRLPTGSVDRRRFPSPAFTDLLFWPFAELPFAVARVAFACLLAVLAAASVFCWMRALRWRPAWPWVAVILLLTLFSYPVLEGVYAGQVGLLVGFLLSAAILALVREKLLLSGVLAALTVIKPQVTGLAILYLLVWSLRDWRRRSRFCLGFFPILFLLIAASLAVWPHWVGTWVRVVLEYRGDHPPSLLSGLFASLLGPRLAAPASFVMTIGLLLAAVLLAWRGRAAAADSPGFWFTLTLLLGITTIAVLPGQAIYDHVILLPGALLLASRWRSMSARWPLKAILAVGAVTLLWPWVTSFVVIALRPLLTRQQFYSRPIFYLPIDMAAVFPFIVLAALTLAARDPKASAQLASSSSEPMPSRNRLKFRSGIS